MSMLKNLTSDESIANERDSVGGASVLNSDAYVAEIKLAYLTKSDGGALGLVVHAVPESGGGEIRQTIYMTSGTAKGGKNYYEKDGEKHYLPGFLLANSLTLLTIGKEISECDTEQKVIAAWSREAKAEVPTKVDMITELLGQKVMVGLIKQIEDKTKKNDATNVYEPTGETREVNEIDKFFRARDGMTTAEIRAQAVASAFLATWKAKWAGQVRNKSKGTAGKAGAPKAAAGGAGPKVSLFG